MAPPWLGTRSSPLRSCIVGAGAIAEHHLRWFTTTDRATLDTVVDSSTALAVYAGERFSAANTTSDLTAALAREPDVVHVLTPPATHSTLVRQALDAGAHVVCEKPLALSADMVDDLLAHAERRGRLLIENHNYRFNREVQELRQLVAARTIGTIHEIEVRVNLHITAPGSRFADSNYRHPVHDLPAGAIHDFLPHMTYLPLVLAPKLTVDHVWARLSRLSDETMFRYDDLDAMLLGSTPSGPLRVRMRFDAVGHPEAFELRVHGSSGEASIELFQRRIEHRLARARARQLAPVMDQVAAGISLWRSAAINLIAKLQGRTPYEGIAELLEQTYRALVDGAQPPVTPTDIRSASRLADRIIGAATR